MKAIVNRLYVLLRWSERYTKTDMVYLTTSGFWLSFGQVIASIAAFALSILFANVLSPAIYGSYKYVLAVGGFLALPALNGINSALIQSVSKGNVQTFRLAFWTKLKWSIIGMGAGLCIALYYFVHGNDLFALSFVILSFCIPLMEVFVLYDPLLQGLTRFRLSAMYFFFSQLAVSILIAASIVFSGNLVVVLLAYAAGWLMVRICCTILTLRKVTLSGDIDPSVIPYGKHLTVIGVIGTIATYADRLLIFHYLGAVELAVYTVATGPAEQLKALFKNITSLALPRLSRRSRAELASTTFQKTWRLALGVLVVAILFAAVIPFIYPLLFPAYPGAILLAQVYALSTVGVAISLPQTALQAASATRLLYVLNIVTSLIQIVALVVGVLLFGLWGVVIARTAVRILNLLFALVLASRVTRL